LPFTIIRPFNAVGIGEKRAKMEKEIFSGNIRLAMSHVVPDFVQKILKGQNPLHILGKGNQVRHYTYAGDLAQGIRLCVESEKAINEDFNLSTPVSTTVLELAEIVWQKINGDKTFRYVSDEPFLYDVQKRIPSVEKARRILGFEAKTTLDEALDEIIPWIREQIKAGAF
jgi:nucleoside-diphosphate-sugar epimerase